MNPKDKIRIMISSRSNSPVFDPPVPLKELRENLQTFIQEEVTLAGEQIFEVWICEEDTGSGVSSWWEESEKQIRKSDLVLVLYTGEAGSRIGKLGMGICHAELFEAAKYSREKILPIVTLVPEPSKGNKPDRDFQKYVGELHAWPNAPESREELQKLCEELLCKSLVDLTKRAVKRRRGASFDLGNALDWSKLDFATRKQRIEEVLQGVLESDMSGKPVQLHGGRNGVVADLLGTRVCWAIHGIPAATSIAAAREMVGQPFVFDHLSVRLLKKHDAAGPVHIIGCHKNITEAQAIRILGVPDCTLVKTDFGLYVVDKTLKVQILFLAGCRDVTATQSGITEMFQWLESAEESDDVARRALARRRILEAIAEEVE